MTFGFKETISSVLALIKSRPERIREEKYPVACFLLTKTEILKTGTVGVA